ncbi:MAG: arylesterase [Methyloligellaceae bacterium]
MLKFGFSPLLLLLLVLPLIWPDAASAQNVSLKPDKPIRIVAYGDSLTAGYRLPQDQAFPVRLEKALRKRGYNVIVMNSGVSGDTAAAGLERLQWSLPQKLDAVILELGANDALRGLSPAVTKHALEEIIKQLKNRNAEVLIAGMQSPRGYGPEYAKAFASIFPTLAEKYGLIHYPFFLKGVALRPELNLSDGMHPNKKGVEVLVENILPSVENLIRRVQDKKLKEASGPG